MDEAHEQRVVRSLGEYQTIDGAAQVLGLTYWAVRGLIKRHNVPTVKLGRSTLVKLDDLTDVARDQSQLRERGYYKR